MGWRKLCEVSGARPTTPVVRETDKVGDAMLVLTSKRREGAYGLAAECWPIGTHPSPGVWFYHPAYAEFSRTYRAKTVAHELLHYYYNLPDEYEYDKKGKPVPQKRPCIMANYIVYPADSLCDDCRKKVETQRKSRANSGR